MRLLKVSGALVALLLVTSCGSFQTSDFQIMVRLPASGDCFAIRVMSGEETRYPKQECDHITDRAIFLTSKNWKLLREDIQKNCQYSQCEQIEGAADGLFLSIDKALQTP